MIVKGNLHSSGKILGEYITTQGDNEELDEPFAVVGTINKDVKMAVQEMDAYKKLTKARYGLYHIQISPDPTEMMNAGAWQFSIDTTLDMLECTGQPYVAFPHTKEGRTHMHVVVQRYNEKTGKMIAFSNSYRKHDKAREIIEIELNHKRTPKRNKNHAIVKEHMTEIWHSTKTGPDFIHAANTMGYLISKGGQNRPYQVVIAPGVAFDLVRKIQGAKTDDVRQRLSGLTLPNDKEAIGVMRERFKAEEKKHKAKEQFNTYSDDVREETYFEKLSRELKEQLETMNKRSKGMGL